MSFYKKQFARAEEDAKSSVQELGHCEAAMIEFEMEPAPALVQDFQKKRRTKLE